VTAAIVQPGLAVDRELRRVKLLSLGRVAELLAVDRATVWRWRRRVSNPLPVVFLPGGMARVALAALERWVADEDADARRRGAC